MTPTEFRAALARLQLSQLGAARLLQVDGRTARRWAQHGVNGPTAVLLRLLLNGKVRLRDIEAIHDDEGDENANA